MIIDSDIWIWYMRGNPKVKKTLIDSGETFEISSVTYLELVQGMHNKQELAVLRKVLRKWNVNIVHPDSEISMKAMSYMDQFYLSHSIGALDAIIASCSFCTGQPLLTGNYKHFQMIKEIEVYKFRP